ncbi:dihydropyrimidinase [soil metagenome]
MDLLLKNGLIVSDGLEFTGDLAIRGGVVKAVGDLNGVEATKVIDCTGKIILPGAVDLGVNLFDNGDFDPESGAGFSMTSRHAALGGVTTLVSAVEMVKDEDVSVTIRSQQEVDEKKAYVDFGYHIIVPDWNAGTIEKARAATLAGVPSFWIRRTQCDGSNLPAPALLYAALKELPADTLAIVSPFEAALHLVHAKRLQALGAAGAWKDVYPEALEASFIASLSGIANGCAARILVAGISTAASAMALQQVREANPQIVGAALLPHLVYTDSDELAPATWPPVRTKKDQQALFAMLEDGVLSAVLSDHKPRTAAEGAGKNGLPATGSATLAHFLGALHHEASKWRLSLAAISQCACADPAKLAGLYPKKGSLQPGSDADIVIIDPQKVRETTAGLSASPMDFKDPLERFVFQGSLEAVYLRGNAIVENGKLVESPSGKFLTRKMSLK